MISKINMSNNKSQNLSFQAIKYRGHWNKSLQNTISNSDSFAKLAEGKDVSLAYKHNDDGIDHLLEIFVDTENGPLNIIKCLGKSYTKAVDNTVDFINTLKSSKDINKLINIAESSSPIPESKHIISDYAKNNRQNLWLKELRDIAKENENPNPVKQFFSKITNLFYT